MVGFVVFGAGRIGQIHAANVAAHPRAQLRAVVDVDRAAASALAERHGARAIDEADAALADSGVDAALIASSTNTHVDLILKAAAARKAIFCEKPIDLDLARVDSCLQAVAAAGVPLFVAFNRRFDPSFRKLRDALRAGEIGQLELVSITSRDPGPPPMDYVKVSGGLFRDMMIHDLDMARWLLDEEPVSVFAAASCLVDAEIGAAGDVDTALVTLKTASGLLCQISNSRRASYGYDQRVEVLGSAGMLQAGNVNESTVSRWGEAGVTAAKPLRFFLERYTPAYQAELDVFVNALERGEAMQPGAHDGRQALALADAASESARRGQPVEVDFAS